MQKLRLMCHPWYRVLTNSKLYEVLLATILSSKMSITLLRT